MGPKSLIIIRPLQYGRVGFLFGVPASGVGLRLRDRGLRLRDELLRVRTAVFRLNLQLKALNPRP